MTAIQCQPQRTIRFYGPLAKALGRRSFSAIGLNSASEVMRCLLSNFPQLGSHMRGRHYRVVMNGRAISGEELNDPVGIGHEIHIIPAICGAGGGNPLTTILTGVALIGAGLLFPFASSFLTPLGIGLVLQGVAEMISPTPNDTPESTDPSNRSYNFSGLQQTSREGVPVPLVYGEIVTGSVVLSVNIERDDEKLVQVFEEGLGNPNPDPNPVPSEGSDGGDDGSGTGDNDYDLHERYPGIAWGYYSQVYYEYDSVCGCPNSYAPCDYSPAPTTQIMIPSWGIYPHANGFYTASVPVVQLVGRGPGQTTTNSCGGVKRGYSFAWTDYAPRPASYSNPSNRYFENVTYSYGAVPVGYRIWQGPAKLFNGTTPTNVPFRLIATSSASGYTIPAETFSSNYPNNPFE